MLALTLESNSRVATALQTAPESARHAASWCSLKEAVESCDYDVSLKIFPVFRGAADSQEVSQLEATLLARYFVDILQQQPPAVEEAFEKYEEYNNRVAMALSDGVVREKTRTKIVSLTRAARRVPIKWRP